MARTLPPVYSPLSLLALGSGLLAMRDPRAAERAVTQALGSFGPREILLTDSGTAALTLALRAAAHAGLTPVALPAYCCFDVATAAEGADVPVLLYDLDPATLGPKPGSLCRALELGARTVVVAHLYGIPVEVRSVEEIAAGFGALVIEDAAQSTGAALGGRALGGFGRLAVLSFGRGKGLTGGRGGALLVHDAPILDVARARRELLPARTGTGELIAAVAQWILARPAFYALPASLPFLGLGETIYRPPLPPRAMSAFSLGVLARTLGLAGSETLRRRANATRLLAAVEGVPGLAAVQGPPDSEPGFLRLPVLVAESARGRFRSAEARRLGIMPGYPRTLGGLPGLETRVLNRDVSLPGANRLLDALFTIPTHGQLAEGDLQALEGWIHGSGP